METINNFEFEKIVKKEFLKFLKDNKAAKYYRFNLINSAKNQHFETISFDKALYPIENFLFSQLGHYTDYEILINYAFCWAKTKEGHQYWSNLDEKWKKKLKQLNQITIII